MAIYGKKISQFDKKYLLSGQEEIVVASNGDNKKITLSDVWAISSKKPQYGENLPSVSPTDANKFNTTYWIRDNQEGSVAYSYIAYIDQSGNAGWLCTGYSFNALNPMSDEGKEIIDETIEDKLYDMFRFITEDEYDKRISYNIPFESDKFYCVYESDNEYVVKSDPYKIFINEIDNTRIEFFNNTNERCYLKDYTLTRVFNNDTDQYTFGDNSGITFIDAYSYAYFNINAENGWKLNSYYGEYNLVLKANDFDPERGATVLDSMMISKNTYWTTYQSFGLTEKSIIPDKYGRYNKEYVKFDIPTFGESNSYNDSRLQELINEVNTIFDDVSYIYDWTFMSINNSIPYNAYFTLYQQVFGVENQIDNIRNDISYIVTNYVVND